MCAAKSRNNHLQLLQWSEASAGIVIGKFEEFKYTHDAHAIYFIRLQDEMEMFKALLLNS